MSLIYYVYLFDSSKLASDFRRKCTPSAACGASVGYNSLYSTCSDPITNIGDGVSRLPTHNGRTEIRLNIRVQGGIELLLLKMFNRYGKNEI